MDGALSSLAHAHAHTLQYRNIHTYIYRAATPKTISLSPDFARLSFSTRRSRPMMSEPTPTNNGDAQPTAKAWVVLLTRSNYLAATVLLHYSLRRVESKYPLHVLVTPTLPESAKQTLEDAGCSLINVDVLRPQVEVSVVAERFADTWDKLRAFGLEGFDVGGLAAQLLPLVAPA